MAIEGDTISHEYLPAAAMAAEALVGLYWSAPGALRVERRVAGAEPVVLTPGTHYELGGDGANGLGWIRALQAEAAGTVFRVVRQTPRRQHREFPRQQPIDAAEIEAGLDQAMAIDQEQDAALGRALMWPDGEVAQPLPRKALFAGKFWGADALGNPVPVGGLGGSDAALREDLADAEAAGGRLVGVQRSSVAAVPRTLHDWHNERISLDDYKLATEGLDDRNAFIRAIAAGQAERKAVWLTRHDMFVSSMITVDMPNDAVGSMATWALADLAIRGEGKGQHMVKCAGGFLKVLGGSQQHSVDLQDFAVAADTTGTQTAIEMDCSAYPFFGEWTAQSRINLHFRGADGINNVRHWAMCVKALDWSNIAFSHSLFDGASTPGGQGVVTRRQAGDFACVFDFDGVHARFLSLFYEMGSGSQTANLSNCFFAQNGTDVYVPAGGVNYQGLSITNTESYRGAPGDNVYITSAVPNFIYTGNRAAVHAGYRAVAMDVTQMSSICGNQFFSDLTPNTATAAIDIDGSVLGSQCLIDQNVGASVSVLARLKAGSRGVWFTDRNWATTGMTLVQDMGIGNVIGGRVMTPLGKVGYGAGAWVEVTQTNSKVDPVTANAPVGRVIVHDAALAAGASATFTVNCSAVGAFDHVSAFVSNGNYDVRVKERVAGQFKIEIKNISGGSLTDLVPVDFLTIATR